MRTRRSGTALGLLLWLGTARAQERSPVRVAEDGTLLLEPREGRQAEPSGDDTRVEAMPAPRAEAAPASLPPALPEQRPPGIPRADGTLRPGAFASLGLGVDNAR